MSGFFSQKYKELVPYVPGEQPQGRSYIKLNTNESPFPPSPRAVAAAAEAAKKLQLYSDPEMRLLKKKLSEVYGVPENAIFVCNGSDEVLNFAFMAFCDQGAVFPDVTYGFYEVFAQLNGVKYRKIPLKSDFTVDPADYTGTNEPAFLANPNAPTGVFLPVKEIEKILSSNERRLVVVDEAYIDFGGESCLPLIKKYCNLLVTRTFSKSRSMAGARLGYAFASPALIADLETVKYSTNPYNVNAMTAAAGIGALEDGDYTEKNCLTIASNRAFAAEELEKLSFTVLPSRANFLFARHATVGGEELYLRLKEKGILVRHFGAERIKDFLRITVGSKEEMRALTEALKEILK